MTISPFKGKFKVTSPRGDRFIFGKSEYHGGIDMVGIDDTTVYAVADGTVYNYYEKNGFGNYVRQHTADGTRYFYGHLSKQLVKNGTFVYRGDPIGVMGATGKVKGAHLHLEARMGTQKQSLDIAALTGLQNTVGTYVGVIPNRFSYDDTVNKLVKLGITDENNMSAWELMLSGKAPLVPEYVRTMFERLIDKIQKG